MPYGAGSIPRPYGTGAVPAASVRGRPDRPSFGVRPVRVEAAVDGAGHDDGEGASLVAGEGADGHGQGAFVAEPPQDVRDGRAGLRLPSVVPAVQSADEGEQEVHGSLFMVK